MCGGSFSSVGGRIVSLSGWYNPPPRVVVEACDSFFHGRRLRMVVMDPLPTTEQERRDPTSPRCVCGPLARSERSSRWLSSSSSLVVVRQVSSCPRVFFARLSQTIASIHPCGPLSSFVCFAIAQRKRSRSQRSPEAVSRSLCAMQRTTDRQSCGARRTDGPADSLSVSQCSPSP